MNPNLLLRLFNVAETNEIYLRIVGMMLVYLGIYYIDAARANNQLFMKRSVQLRILSVFIFSGFALSGMGPQILFLFAFADLAGALWTWKAMKV